jgi:large subunit ribosomal protein L18
LFAYEAPIKSGETESTEEFGMSGFSRSVALDRRRKRVRKRIKGTSDKPRLCVFRSAKHIYAQVIDDSAGKTLVSASTLSKDLQAKAGKKSGNKEGAAFVGSEIADRALKEGIKKVVFDRNGFLYHGRVKALSDAARERGLEF